MSPPTRSSSPASPAASPFASPLSPLISSASAFIPPFVSPSLFYLSPVAVSSSWSRPSNYASVAVSPKWSGPSIFDDWSYGTGPCCGRRVAEASI